MRIERPGEYALTAPRPRRGHGTADHGAFESVEFGFWLYLMSDCVLFATLFATYAVLVDNTAGGPAGREIFDLPQVLGETALLLLSSLTCSLAMLALEQGRRDRLLAWLSATFVLGLGFVGFEIAEFRHLIALGFGPARSGFLSAFFTLVGTHGLHVSSGLVWIAVMAAQIVRFGVAAPAVARRMACLSLFWHFLDIVWIGVFTVVYLMGVL